MSWGAHDVTVCFGERHALAGVSLAAVDGQVTGVVGGDGAGKTTLLRALAGGLTVSRGRVRRPAAARIGYLPSSSGTYPDLTVDENLRFAASAYGVPAGAARRRVVDLLDRTGLGPFGSRLAGHLSGGMRQKLGVIRALVQTPDLLVLDEPTTGVDPVSRADLWWLVTRAAAGGAAVVLSTSYLDEAERAGTLLVLDAGEPLAIGTPAEIVAAIPGAVRIARDRPHGDAAGRAWRRQRGWRVWEPHDAPSGTGAPMHDLQDAVTALALAHERARATTGRDGWRSHDERGRSSTPEARAVPGRREGRGRRRLRGAAMHAPLVATRAVTRRFGGFVAVEDVDLAVRGGEIVGLLGANGAGKTTLIRMVLGLTRPSDGSVALFGRPPSRDTRRRLGYVPQGLGLYGDLTGAENLAFSAAAFGRGGGMPDGLDGLADVPVAQLSLGVQRRTAFAAALGHDPDLLVLDEPTSGVGPLARARLWETVRRATEEGAGALVTTHAMEEAEQCDRLVVMASGRVVVEGTVDDIVGSGHVVVVDADDWGAAFAAVDAAGLPIALVGRSLHVPGATVPEVERALGDLDAQVRESPATLQERFVQLVSGADPAR